MVRDRGYIYAPPARAAVGSGDARRRGVAGLPRTWGLCGALLLTTSALSGCADSVPSVTDQTPPVSTFALSLPGARRLEVAPGTTYVTRSETVTVIIEIDEPGSISFTTDGSDPALRGNPNASKGGRRVVFGLTPDRPVRWRATDEFGNAGEDLRVDFVLDDVAPVVTLDPDGGDYDGPITVNITTDEPARLELRTDGRWPSPGSPQLIVVDAPYTVALSKDAGLRLYAYDKAGNRSVPIEADYRVDGTAPTTWATPPAGWYPAPISVSVRTDDPAATVHYTLDGSPPTYDSPVLSGALDLAADTTLRHRGIDPGGNAEEVRTARYTFGPRPAPAPARTEDDVHDTAGGLALGRALLELAGPLGGGAAPFATAATTGAWTAYGHGRAALDAAMLYAGVEPHVWHSPGMVALAGSGQGTPDEDGNGANLDDTWRARAAGLATTLQAPAPPPGYNPVSVPYRAGLAVSLQPTEPELAADGRPRWVSEPTRARWAGSRVSDRVITPAAAGAWLSAVAARARSGMAGTRTSGGTALARAASPVIGLRCGGCHSTAGALPALDNMAVVAADTLLINRENPSESRVLRLLSGAEAHRDLDPAPEARVAAVRAWIAGGAVAIDTPPQVGFDAESARDAAILLEAAAFAADHLQRLAGVDTERGVLGANAAATHLAAASEVLEGPGPDGLGRRVERAQLRDRDLVVADHAAWVRGLAELKVARRAAEARVPGLALPAVALLDPLPSAVAALLAVQHEDGTFPARQVPGAPGDLDVDALATARATVALMAARAAGFAEAEAPAEAAADALLGLLDASGWVRDGVSADGDELPGPRRVVVQLAAAEAWLAVDAWPRFLSAAEVLLARLDALWWPADADRPLSTWGSPDLALNPALAADIVRTLVAAGRAGVAPARTAARLEALVQGPLLGTLLLSEGWLTGEIALGADDDGDGVRKPEAAMVQDRVGAPPVFTGASLR